MHTEPVFAWLGERKAAAVARGVSLVDLGIGSPDQPTPAPIVEAITRSYHDGEANRYPPFSGIADFREAVAAHMRSRYDLELDPAGEVVCTSGIEEGFTQALLALLDPGDTLLIPDVAYPLHRRGPELLRIALREYPTAAGPEALTEWLVSQAPRAIVVSYPHNPTGMVASRGALQRVVDHCRANGVLLLSDLAYAELTFAGHEAPSILEFEGARDIAIEFHSFSKSYNMAGSRVGFAVGDRRLIARLDAVRSRTGYGTPVPIQRGAICALANARAMTAVCRRTYQERRDAVTACFAERGWCVTAPAGGMFLWLRLPDGLDDLQFVSAAIDSGVVLVPGRAFGDAGAGFVRLSLVAPVERLCAAVDVIDAVRAELTERPLRPAC